MVIIVVLTIAFIASAVSGVAKGVQWLSNTNMVLAARTGASGGDATETWLSGWTVFYGAWWISWTPFVGTFIARISRGRTIRQFVAGVILIPSAVSLVWFAIFGGAAISLQRAGTDLASLSLEGQLFGVLQAYPLGSVLGVVAMLLIAIFFVSGADAASVVMGTLSQRGTIHPSRGIVIFWGTVMGAISAIMLMVGGSEALSGIQNVTIIMAVPFALVMVLLCFALMKDLRQDPLVLRTDRSQQAVEQAVDYGTQQHGDGFFLNAKPAPAPLRADASGNGRGHDPREAGARPPEATRT